MEGFRDAIKAMMAGQELSELAAAKRCGVPRATFQRIMRDRWADPDQAFRIVTGLPATPADRLPLVVAYLRDIVAVLGVSPDGIQITLPGEIIEHLISAPAGLRDMFAQLITDAALDPQLARVLEALQGLQLRHHGQHVAPHQTTLIFGAGGMGKSALVAEAAALTTPAPDTPGETAARRKALSKDYRAPGKARTLRKAQ